MKLIFFGDCMFGRDGNSFISNPFKFVIDILNDADYIFFNLETVISTKYLPDEYKDDKVFNYQSNGKQLITLKRLIKCPIFVSIANNHSLDFNKYGYQMTQQFLKSNKYLFSIGKNLVSDKNICFINVSDHCGCKDIKKWGDNIWIIDYNNLDLLIEKIRRNSKKKMVIVSIHWGANYITEVSDFMKKTGKLLIDNGAKVVFGHSAHHIAPIPFEQYNNGLIIYGLGDFINDYAVDANFESDKCDLLIFDSDSNNVESINMIRRFEGKSSIPKPIRYKLGGKTKKSSKKFKKSRVRNKIINI